MNVGHTELSALREYVGQLRTFSKQQEDEMKLVRKRRNLKVLATNQEWEAKKITQLQAVFSSSKASAFWLQYYILLL